MESNTQEATPRTDAAVMDCDQTAIGFDGLRDCSINNELACYQAEADRAALIAALTYIATRVTTQNVTESDLLREFRAQATAALAKVRHAEPALDAYGKVRP